MSNNKATGLCLIVLGAAVIVMTMTMTVSITSMAEEVGPQLFPMIAGIGILVCGVGIFFQKEEKPSENNKTEDEVSEIDWTMMRHILLLGLVLILYAVALYWLGYMVSTFAALLVLTKLLSGEKKIPWFRIVLFALIVTVVIYYIMGNLFQVILPRGELF
ncbi:MAG: tripartite tricarboxylate transporter TctB family protein [Lachnospiraceae bacterium]|nr:tripartite tricarboxylate transporter TctB family protein [Lachnospiraceae bacterium]